MKIKKLIFSLVLCTLTKIYCQDGSLDTTFGPNQNGTVITPPTTFGGANFAEVFSIGLQSTGKIIAVGTSDIGSDIIAVLARYNTNGSLDTTFGTNGTTSISLGAGNDSLSTTLAIQTDDKIVVGDRAFIGGVEQFIVARLQANGSLDSSFGTGGISTLVIGTNSFITSVKIQADGKIVAGGRSTVSGVTSFTLARFNTNGTVDTSFGNPNGFVTFQFPGSTSSQIDSIAIQSDGKIVAAGRTTIGGVIQFAVARFNSDGSVDTTFGTGGAVTIPISTFSSITSVLIQPDSKILVGGTATINGSDTFAFARLLTNGSLDNSFGTGGIVDLPLSVFGAGTSFAELESITIQSNGKIIAGGSADPGGIQTFSLARLLINGSLDTSFGTNGIVNVLPLTLFGANPLDASINSILLQSDGKLLAGGLFDNISASNFALARFNILTSCFTNLTQAIIEKYGV